MKEMTQKVINLPEDVWFSWEILYNIGTQCYSVVLRLSSQQLREWKPMLLRS